MGPRRMKPCGTEAAAARHYVNGETPCPPCAEAHRVRGRRQYRERNGYRERTSHKIADYLETHGPLEVNALVDLIQERHDIKDATIHRAVWRMVKDGRLIVEYDPVFPLTVEVP